MTFTPIQTEVQKEQNEKVETKYAVTFFFCLWKADNNTWKM